MKHTDHTLCWHCRHAVPTKDKITGEYLTGCAWSIDRRPVEGWRTCQHRMYEAQKGGMIHSYTVTECLNLRRDNMVKIKPEYIFPLLLILLDVGAAVTYAVQKDYKKAVYWLAAAVLNVTVTF